MFAFSLGTLSGATCILLYTFFQFYSVVSWYNNVDNFANSLFFFFFFFVDYYKVWSSGRHLVIRQYQSHTSLCVSFSRTAAELCIYHLFVWSNLNFLQISQWIPFPTQSSLVLYSFCANLLHSHIMWLMVSSLSPHNLYLLFCFVLSILALIWLVLMALYCDYYY